ncbi:helix-turn-helix transcriptional regulator [Glycomyces harbinensis]|uniref:Predicted DNA-binding transcriptional regulator YafY, contains an HTH and WYL domains n=1 Tax=Glycomyces harbinensis TaxID=58114 RepID=A0A1G7AJ67_9ACTN|nr:WYL domain-containing protein [Glycomyces harbinensis]SDE14055.1 Predicted DNA-binding transcriptional regulator YafY, contains an HTH and WYL domains [Glycomyces harbinensis]
MSDVTGRMLSLLATLQTGRSFSGEELAARLGVSPRTLRRDVDRLRGHGYPVETRPGPGGHYRLAAGRTMPPLMLEDDEAMAMLLGLAALGAAGSADEGSLDDAATRAYGKLEQFLPKRLRPRIARLRTSLETGPKSAPSISAADVGLLADAIGSRQVVVFDYERKGGAVTSRRVEPHRQAHHLERWYLLGWDVDRGDWRVFRVDRMSGLRVSTARFASRPVPADTAIDYLASGINRSREAMVITVEAPADAVADAFRFDNAEVEPLGERRTRVRLRLETWEWPLVALAFLDADFAIEGPDRFRQGLKGFGERLGRALDDRGGRG